MKNRMRQTTPLITLLVLLCSASVTRAQISDRVRLKRGSSVSGTIGRTHADWVEVTDRKDVKRRIESRDIDYVTFTGEPSPAKSARSAIRGGQFEDARTALKKIVAGSVARQIVVREIEYFGILCDTRLARDQTQLRAAAKRATAFHKANADSFHFYEVAQIIGDLASALETYDAASTAYSQIGNAPWPSYKLRSNVLQGQALLMANKPAQAEAFFDKAIAASATDEATEREQLLARMGKAACMAENGKADEAISMMEKMIADNDAKDTELFAKAYNVLGACYEKKGDSKGSLLAYLHVDLLFNSDANAHAEALFHLSTLWTTERRPDRAADSRDLLKSRYPASRWASRKK